jgi:hypothetical protein
MARLIMDRFPYCRTSMFCLQEAGTGFAPIQDSREFPEPIPGSSSGSTSRLAEKPTVKGFITSVRQLCAIESRLLLRGTLIREITSVHINAHGCV